MPNPNRNPNPSVSNLKFSVDSQTSSVSVDSGAELCPKALVDKGYTLAEKLGEGAFSKVYKAYNSLKPELNPMACKRFNLNVKAQEVWREKCLKQEMKIMMKIKHPNIVPAYDVIKTRNAAFIFMKFAQNGNIGSYLERTAKPIEEPKAKMWFNDILCGLSFLHEKNIAHRDIKPDNFLLDNDFKDAMLTDFGFSCMALDSERLMKGTNCGTDVYKAPEVLTLRDGHVYDAKKADIFSMGVSLFEMLNFNKPFGDSVDPIPEYLKKQKNRSYKLNKTVKMSKTARECYQLFLEPNPDKRMTAEMALKLKWFKE